jgi:hypothetical protein
VSLVVFAVLFSVGGASDGVAQAVSAGRRFGAGAAGAWSRRPFILRRPIGRGEAQPQSRATRPAADMCSRCDRAVEDAEGRWDTAYLLDVTISDPNGMFSSGPEDSLTASTAFMGLGEVTSCGSTTATWR